MIRFEEIINGHPIQYWKNTQNRWEAVFMDFNLNCIPSGAYDVDDDSDEVLPGVFLAKDMSRWTFPTLAEARNKAYEIARTVLA